MIETAYGHELRHDARVLRAALRDASTTPYWLDDPDRPDPAPALRGSVRTDLLVVGGGYCGLWSAILAKERDPDRRVVLLEGERIGWAASGRNGGFVEADLTHGTANGLRHFGAELDTIERLAAENFAGLVEAIRHHGIDAELVLAPMLTVATEPHQVAELREEHGDRVLEGEALDAYARSPLFRAGILESEGHAYVHPAKLAWGLAAAAARLGVEVHEHSRVTRLRRTAQGVRATTSGGEIDARQVVLATNGFRSLLPGLRPFTVPIYDYVLMTEPLSATQLADIRWTARHGITDSGREFHYSRKTADDRILFGGYDAVYHRGGEVAPEHDQRDETFERLADHFLSTFPSLEGIRFTHKWGGMIDMSTQLVAFHRVTRDRRIAASGGYTGLGVAATRFGAATMLDLLAGASTERTRLRMARRLPVPIPPEPFAYPLVQLMRRAAAKADRTGREGLLLRLVGALGIGFDS